MWVLDFPANEDAPDRWTAYDSSGRVIGAVELKRGPRRPIPNPPAGGPTTFPGSPPIFVDAMGDVILLLEHDDDGAAHFVTRRLR